jgi:hypothetical protein
LRKKHVLLILILMVTCIVLFGEAREKIVDVKIIQDQKIIKKKGRCVQTCKLMNVLK